MPKRTGESQKQRSTVRLPETVESAVAAYAAVASAAGISLLAIVSPAEASVVYTPADIVIRARPEPKPVPLDLNGDGVIDFSFRNATNSAADSRPYSLVVKGRRGNAIWGRGSVSGVFASALPSGFPIGPDKSYFQGTYGLMARDGTTATVGSRPAGQWVDTENRYLGFAFMIDGQVHFGWARLNVIETTGTITGYAYETIPHKPIIAGDTGGSTLIDPNVSSGTTAKQPTLGALAAGSAWRTPAAK